MAVLVISYSRADQAQVRALVSLLKASLRDVERAIFWDEQFEPGESWFDQLKTHIDASPQLFVFWCDHSSNSVQVKREFRYALAMDKRVVPVLLDDTPLAAELAFIHGIDLRGAIRHGRKSRMEWWTTIAVAAAAAIVATVLASLTIFSTESDPIVRGQNSPGFVSELILDNKSSVDLRGELNERSKTLVDEFFQRNLVDPETAEILIESSSIDLSKRDETQSPEALMQFLIVQDYVPLSRIDVRRRVFTPSDSLKDQTVLRLRTTEPPPTAPAASRPSRGVSPLLGATILAILSTLALLSFFGLQRWKHRKFIAREFARYFA
jgi:hypothetical protein